ncbi:hypothetical protein IWX48DRAFT_21405 [Phyllosticta citricarpa]
MCWPFVEYELEEVPRPSLRRKRSKRTKGKRVHWWSSLYSHLVPMYSPSRPQYVQPLYPYNYHPYGYYYPNDCVIYNNPSNQQHVWHGRTEAEVRDDNKVLAERDGANGRHEIMPRNPRPDQSFWVRDVDGTRYIRPYAFIEDNLRPGEWRLDQRHGNLYFVRTRSED